MPKPIDLNDGQRARLDQAFALMRDNSERMLRDIIAALCAPSRSEHISRQVERMIRTTDSDLFEELAAVLFVQSQQEVKLWTMMVDNLTMLVQCNKYRDGVKFEVFDIFAPDDEDDDDC